MVTKFLDGLTNFFGTLSFRVFPSSRLARVVGQVLAYLVWVGLCMLPTAVCWYLAFTVDDGDTARLWVTVGWVIGMISWAWGSSLAFSYLSNQEA